MSRIGKQPVAIPAKVKVEVKGTNVFVEGPKGKLQQSIPGRVTAAVEKDMVVVSRSGDDAEAKALHGLTRALINNMVNGVSKGFEKKLSLIGVGYRAQAVGSKLNLQIGFSHPVVKDMPAGVTVACATQTEILIKGADRQVVGQVAAEVRAIRPPEPYKGKGIRYADERVVLKETKKK